MINLSNTLKKKNNKKGFTLIELIVVIAILGILAAIAIPRFANVQDNASNKAALAEHKTVVSAIQIAKANSANGTVPADATALQPYLQTTIANLEFTKLTFAAGKVTVVSTSKASTPVVTTTEVN